MSEDAFICAILASPQDEAPRLIYADWLEERGDSRGEYLRLLCALNRVAGHDTQAVQMRERLQALEGSIDLSWRALLVGRQNLIAQKRTAKQYQLLRTAYLEALPAAVRAELELAPVLCEPHDAAICRLGYVTPQGVGHDSPVMPAGFAFRQFSWPEQVYAGLAGYPDRHDTEPAYLWPFRVRWVRGQSVDRLSGQLPTFLVPFGWARHHLSALFEATASGLVLVSESFAAGIAISVVLGYLEPDPNPDERIYELGTWG